MYFYFSIFTFWWVVIPIDFSLTSSIEDSPPNSRLRHIQSLQIWTKPFLHEVIVGWYLGGKKKKGIQRATGLPCSTINATIITYQTSPTGTSASWSGRANILTESDKEFIHFLVKRESYMWIGEIFKALDKPGSTILFLTCKKYLGILMWKLEKEPWSNE